MIEDTDDELIKALIELARDQEPLGDEFEAVFNKFREELYEP